MTCAIEDNAYSHEWLSDIIAAFEAEHAESTFKDGEKGVRVILKAEAYSSLNDINFCKNPRGANVTEVLTEKNIVEKLEFSPCARKGKYYTIPYLVDTYGIVYNADLFEENGWKIPNTTTELLALCEEMQGIAVPFISDGTGETACWEEAFNVWWGQYEGVQAYENFWDGVNADGAYSKDVFTQQGRLEALKILEVCVQNEYLSSKSYGANNTETQAVLEFLTSGNSKSRPPIAMIPYGETFGERARAYDSVVSLPKMGIMKVPVVSSIITKCQTIADDTTLSAVIAAIDNGKTSYTGVSEKDFERVKAARAVTGSTPILEIAVGEKSKDTQAVNAFLEFVVSETAFTLAAQNGVTPALKYTLTSSQKEGLNDLKQATLETLGTQKAVYLPLVTHKLLYDGGYRPFTLSAWNAMSAFRSGSKTAQGVYDETLAHYTQSVFEGHLLKAGLIP